MVWVDGDQGVGRGGDCDDEDPTSYPAAPETPYDGVDQDCSGADLVDMDMDGQTSIAADGPDCDDGDATIFVSAPEIPYDDVDQDCDGADLVDVDEDGSPAVEAGGVDCEIGRAAGRERV